MCDGNETLIGYFKTVHGCAHACRDKAEMFAYGTDQHGVDRCWHDNGCTCYCHHATTDFRCDKQIAHDGYYLYKFQEGKKLVIHCHLILVIF